MEEKREHSRHREESEQRHKGCMLHSGDGADPDGLDGVASEVSLASKIV